MTNETDLIKQLKELDEWASSGIWGQYSPSHGPWREHANANLDWSKYDTSHHVSVMRETGPYRVGEFRHANDAAFAEACVNAYRSGDLVPANALEAAQARIAELEEALERIGYAAQFYSQPGTDGMASRYAHESHARLVRAALEGKGYPANQDSHGTDQQ